MFSLAHSFSTIPIQVILKTLQLIKITISARVLTHILVLKFNFPSDLSGVERSQHFTINCEREVLVDELKRRHSEAIFAAQLHTHMVGILVK